MGLHIAALDRSVQETESWLKEIAAAMDTDDRQVAYHALRGTLFTLRDRLDPGAADDFAAQLPLVVRGIFYEGYHHNRKPERYRSRDEFLRRVNRDFARINYDDPEMAARAVFIVLRHRISRGATDKLRHMLPESVRDLWPEEVVQ